MEPTAATPSLEDILHGRIAADGPLGFADFMAAALYEPGLGYYARGTRQVGRAGDFFTSVSVGPLFGELLARRFLRHWRDAGNPGRWRIIECGSHDGTLAADVLASLAAIEPRAFEALEYAIPEPLDLLRAAQRETLLGFPETVRFLDDARLLADDPLPGVAFGNEVLDALPCHLVEWRGGRWLECRVANSQDGGFGWELSEISDPALMAALKPIAGDFPDGYRTEVRTCYRDFLKPLAASLTHGLMIWVDYGFARPDYYHPARDSGTLRTFSKHRAGENPLENPGAADISAHVDFTAVAETAANLGGNAMVFRDQGAWLTEVARDWLLAREDRPEPDLLRQFQTLIHPGQLGGRFHVLELSWRPDAVPADPDALARRLFAASP
jgi:SAM-dependent MidA family methyltransferase